MRVNQNQKVKDAFVVATTDIAAVDAVVVVVVVV